MWVIAKKIIAILLWSIFLVFLLNHFMISVLLTMVLYSGTSLSDGFTQGFGITMGVLNLVLVPVSLFMFSIFAYKNMLPKFYLSKGLNESTSKIRTCTSVLLSILWKWLLWGVIPFSIVMAVLFISGNNTYFLIPVSALYLEYTLLFNVFRLLMIAPKVADVDSNKCK